MKLIILSGPSGSGKTTTWLPRLSESLHSPICDTGDFFKAQLGYQRLTAKKPVGRPTSVNNGIRAFKEFYLSERFAAGLAEYERQKASGECTGYDIIEYIECLRALCPDIPARSVKVMQTTLGANVAITTAINTTEYHYLVDLYGIDYCCFINLLPKETVGRVGDNRSAIQPHPDMLAFEYSYDWNSIDTAVKKAIEDLRAHWMYKNLGGAYV